MTDPRSLSKRVEYSLLGAVLLLFAVLSTVGITWGLPSRDIDQYLFGKDDPVWSGEKIYRLAGAADRFSPDRGADVDVDPLTKNIGEPILLTGTEEDIARIYLRYRLFTYQPDEMITMMSLAGMKPRELEFDPRLYQYGGLFIYPVGGLIAACGAVGLIDVRGDVVYYLDNPDEFGKFYIVARAYSAAWGLIGVLVVFAIAKRLAGSRAGLLAALLFTLIPVVICMAHEGKPHLPGAVLMLMAVWFALQYLSPAQYATTTGCHSSREAKACADYEEKDRRYFRRQWWLMCLCCGASLGMVLSSAPIFVLIPLVAWMAARKWANEGRACALYSQHVQFESAWPLCIKQSAGGIAVAFLFYLLTNPYIMVNAIFNREVLQSNFGNSLAMYEIDRIVEGFVRVMELTAEGATHPVVVLGVLALLIAAVRKNTAMLPLAIPALVFFLQFVLIGAGKPAEYGRFGIFTNTALAVGCATALFDRRPRIHLQIDRVATLCIALWVAGNGVMYLRGFYLDAHSEGTRFNLASAISSTDSRFKTSAFAVTAEPAPYCLPPIDFRSTSILLLNATDRLDVPNGPRADLLIPTDSPKHRPNPLPHQISQFEDLGRRAVNLWLKRPTPISWANKPFRWESL